MTITKFSRYVLWVNLILAVLLVTQLSYSANLIGHHIKSDESSQVPIEYSQSVAARNL